MNRRDAVKALTISAGGCLIIPELVFSSCMAEPYQPVFFTETDVLLLHEIGETILPETEDSPGAKSLKVAHFIDLYVADCYAPKNQKLVQEGLIAIQTDCMSRHGKEFVDIAAEQKHQFLVKLAQEAKASTEPHYFSLLKSLVLFGYFTSKEGANKALRYLPIPGKYEGDYPYKTGEKAWALG